jgi:CRISPR-associated protein Cas1
MAYNSDIKHELRSVSTQDGSLWDRLIVPGGLWAGWMRVRSNAGCAGGDGVSVRAFERNAPRRLDSLTRALVTGHYRPGPMRHIELPKKSGGSRPLDIPCVADRVVQTSAAMLLTSVIDPLLEPESYAYRPGRGVAQAVAAVLRARRDGYRWTAQGDVEHCFEEIPHTPLLETLERVCADARLTDLVALWLESHAPRGVGIPQGSPISPILCNLHLDAVDQAISGHGVRLVRFADDFVLMTRTATEAESALERMSALLRQHGLGMNPDKVRIRAFDQSLRFLGHVFARGMAWKEVTLDDPPALPDAPTDSQLDAFALPPPDAGNGKEKTIEGDAGAFRRSTVLYLVETSARLMVRNESFVAAAPGPDGEPAAPRLQVHAARLDRIEIGPGAEADWDALKLAAAHDVPIAQTDGWGRTLGWWSGNRDPQARRTMAQARYLAVPARADALARTLALGRVRNQRLMLRRLNEKRKDADVAGACVSLKRVAARLGVSTDIATARGHEGSAGAIYWPAFAHVFDPAFGFAGFRERRPPPDPINACLGYLYALLERDIRVAIQRAGLHPGLGSLHAARDGGDALVYDLMEAFRAAVSEAVLTTLTGRRAIRPDMFVMLDFIDPNGAHELECRIEIEGKKALIRGHESWLARPIKSRRTGKKILWRALFEEEARALGALFDGRAERFVPYEIDF